MDFTRWQGCYKRGWGKELVPEAFAHPAKVAYGLAERIYRHMAEEGWTREGDTVIDPFGGIGGCGYWALRNGLHFVGVELEPRFVELAQRNIDLWNSRYAGRFRRWGTARVVQGDSRRLLDVVGEAACCVSSPPFADQNDHERPIDSTRGKNGRHTISLPYGLQNGNLGNLPARDADFADSLKTVDKGVNLCYHSIHENTTQAQKDKSPSSGRGDNQNVRGRADIVSDSRETWNEPVGHTEAIEACRSDANGLGGDKTRIQNRNGQTAKVLAGEKTTKGNGRKSRKENQRLETLGMEGREGTQGLPSESPKREMQCLWKPAESVDPSHRLRPLQQRSEEPGSSMRFMSHEIAQEGVLGRGEGRKDSAEVERPDRLEEEIADFCVSSPPYAEGGVQQGNEHHPDRIEGSQIVIGRYPNTSGQLGQEEPDTFWSSARVIVEQTYAALRPGGHAVWIVKHFVRNKALVDFPGQWRALCESVGFVTLHEHHAMLVEDNGTQIAIDGNHKRHKTERKSFFRRLAESKGSPRIDFETVYCMVKPARVMP